MQASLMVQNASGAQFIIDNQLRFNQKYPQLSQFIWETCIFLQTLKELWDL